jgi:hypothetical protein
MYPDTSSTNRRGNLLDTGRQQPQQDGSPAPTEGDTCSAPRLYAPAKAAELLTVSESWLRRQAGQRRIPCTFLGRYLRFSDRDLNAIITACARPAHSPGRRRPGSRRR